METVVSFPWTSQGWREGNKLNNTSHMHCFYCFWSQKKLSCVSFNLQTRFRIFTLWLSAPLSRSLMPSQPRDHYLTVFMSWGTHLFLRIQADSPDPTQPEPSPPGKTPTVSIELLSSEHSAFLCPYHGELTHTHTHTHTSCSLLPATTKCHPSLWSLPMNHSHQWHAFRHQLVSHDVSGKRQAHAVRQEQFKRSWASLI